MGNLKNDSGRITGGGDKGPLYAICPDTKKGSMMGSIMVVLREGWGVRT